MNLEKGKGYGYNRPKTVIVILSKNAILSQKVVPYSLPNLKYQW